ncbi:MAG: hypothetical protein IPM21_10905 [Acidobacteria bacterium]|nr:hypothetical protein [Acidobacteriota bacterium]
MCLQIILEEAGGRLTDLRGTPYRYDVRDLQNWGGIVATNGCVHATTIERSARECVNLEVVKYRS